MPRAHLNDVSIPVPNCECSACCEARAASANFQDVAASLSRAKPPAPLLVVPVELKPAPPPGEIAQYRIVVGHFSNADYKGWAQLQHPTKPHERPTIVVEKLVQRADAAGQPRWDQTHDYRHVIAAALLGRERRNDALSPEQERLATVIAGAIDDALDDRASTTTIPMRIPCPGCHELHIDEGEFATKPHHTHSCQHCGLTWRPAVVNTVGVQFLPGFKNEPARAVGTMFCGTPDHIDHCVNCSRPRSDHTTRNWCPNG